MALDFSLSRASKRVFVGIVGAVAGTVLISPPCLAQSRNEAGASPTARPSKKAGEKRPRFVIALGYGVAPVALVTTWSHFPFLRVGVRYKWLEVDVEALFFMQASDWIKRYHVIASCGIWAYSLRRSWVRLRHGVRGGFWAEVKQKILDPDHVDEEDRILVPMGVGHLVEASFRLWEGLWAEVSPANVGFPFMYFLYVGFRLEV